MRAAKASGPPLRYYGNETAEADEKRGAVEDTEGRVAAQDFSREESHGLSADRAVCPICPHACALAEGQTGLCRARVAEGGDDCMRESALRAARNSLFNIDDSAPARQTGTITYIFIPQ